MNASFENAENTAFRSPDDAIAAPIISAPRARLSSHRVLLVDDEQNVIAAMRRLLRREGYELFSANSASTALALLEATPVQLIISDYRMPGTTGIELLREVRKRWPATLRIILSGYSDVGTIITAVNEGEIYKFLTKPWNDEEIKLHVRRALEQFDLQEENRRMAREIAIQNERLRELNALLEQSAEDASAGLASAQSLLEALGVGLVMVDRAGLVVTANLRASTIVSPKGSDLIGISAHAALPDALYELICVAEESVSGCAAGRIVLGGRGLQCRISPMEAAEGRLGSIVALWEEVE
jgi:CheY-like chemotaxis protein